MATDPRIRCSDADRDRCASALREHHAVGRLTAEEFNERLDKAYAAKTMGDLDELLSDLPAADSYQLPVPSGKAPPPIRPAGASPQVTGRLSPVWRAAWASWATVSLVCFVIWVLAGMHGYPWPVWVAGPWGAVLAGRWLFGTAPHHHDHGAFHQQRRAFHQDLRERRRELRDEFRGSRHQLRDDLRSRRDDLRGG